jgi:hypothetical protein
MPEAGLIVTPAGAWSSRAYLRRQGKRQNGA